MILHKYRGHLREKKLIFLSPLYSEAGFNPGNVMTRNRYIDCRANAAVAVIQQRRVVPGMALSKTLRHWVPLWVRPSNDPEVGNSELINREGRRLFAATANGDFRSLLADAN